MNGVEAMTRNRKLRKNAAFILLIILPAMLAGLAACASKREISFTQPQTPRYIVPPQHSTASAQTADGSLWVRGSRVGTVSDFRACDVNDLVTIKIVESTSATNTARVSTERDDSGKRGLSSLLGLENRLLPRSVIDNSSAINASTTEEFESDGTNTRTEKITSTMTARVIERLPNGNLIIQGVREVIVNHERQTMILQGIVRPVDIDDTNSINSTKIADLQIRYSGSGVLSENLRRGWLSRLVNYVWPF
jgi:flagellar L-ring protein precursor FlgH